MLRIHGRRTHKPGFYLLINFEHFSKKNADHIIVLSGRLIVATSVNLDRNENTADYFAMNTKLLVF